MIDSCTTTTVPSFPAIQELYGLSVSEVNWTVAIPALGLAVGPLIWSSLADIYGRRVIFIVGTTIALAASIGAAKAPSYGSYMASRFFQGFGVSPAATVGLAIINDLFFEYQRGMKIGMWVIALDLGLLFGPLIGGFVNLIDQFWVNWFTAILFGTILVAELAFLPETLFPRNEMLRRMPYAHGGGEVTDIEKTERRLSNATDVDLVRTKNLPFINVKPIPGIRHPKPWDAAVRFAFTFKYAAVSISVFFFCFAWYWWMLSVITYIPFAYIQYQPHIQGLLFIGLILGTVSAEIFCSGRLSDQIILRLAKKNNGIRLPEMRLLLAYPAAALSATGLIIWGISIDKAYHWMVGQVAFFLCKPVFPTFSLYFLSHLSSNQYRYSRRRNPNRQHHSRRLRRGLLSIAIDEHDHFLLGAAESQRVRESVLHRALGDLCWLHLDFCHAGYLDFLLERAGDCCDS